MSNKDAINLSLSLLESPPFGVKTDMNIFLFAKHSHKHPAGVEIDMNCLHARFFVCKASFLESSRHLHPFGVEIDMNGYMQTFFVYQLS